MEDRTVEVEQGEERRWKEQRVKRNTGGRKVGQWMCKGERRKEVEGAV